MIQDILLFLMFSAARTDGGFESTLTPEKLSSQIHIYKAVRMCLGEPCKTPHEPVFSCMCLDQYLCSARSESQEGHCTFTHLGFTWLQAPMLQRLNYVFGEEFVEWLRYKWGPKFPMLNDSVTLLSETEEFRI